MPPYGVSEIPAWAQFDSKTGLEDLTGLFFHRPAVTGRPQT